MYDVVYEIIQLLHLSGLSALDSARCPLRSRSATSEFYHARSRSIDFRPDPLRFPLRSHAVVTNIIEQSS